MTEAEKRHQEEAVPGTTNHNRVTQALRKAHSDE